MLTNNVGKAWILKLDPNMLTAKVAADDKVSIFKSFLNNLSDSISRYPLSSDDHDEVQIIRALSGEIVGAAGLSFDENSNKNKK